MKGGVGTEGGKERPLSTQLLLFTKGNAVILAFRGSQPVGLFDWLQNFRLATNRVGYSYAAMGTVTSAELSGSGAGPATHARIDDAFKDGCKYSRGGCAQTWRTHGGGVCAMTGAWGAARRRMPCTPCTCSVAPDRWLLQ